MDLKSKIEFILGCAIKPSDKVGLISLIIAGKPVTTIELNSLNKCSKTFENYKLLFEEHIDSGLVKLTSMKTSSGIIRQHFSIDDTILENLISNS